MPVRGRRPGGGNWSSSQHHGRCDVGQRRGGQRGGRVDHRAAAERRRDGRLNPHAVAVRASRPRDRDSAERSSTRNARVAARGRPQRAGRQQRGAITDSSATICRGMVTRMTAYRQIGRQFNWPLLAVSSRRSMAAHDPRQPSRRPDSGRSNSAVRGRIVQQAATTVHGGSEPLPPAIGVAMQPFPRWRRASIKRRASSLPVNFYRVPIWISATKRDKRIVLVQRLEEC